MSLRRIAELRKGRRTSCVAQLARDRSSRFTMTKAGYTVHVISDCVTSYDLKKIPEMLTYYTDKGCEVKNLAIYMAAGIT